MSFRFLELSDPAPALDVAVCIGCGCDDNHACYDLEAWDRGDRTSHSESAEFIENLPRIPRPEQPRPPGIEPESGTCRVLTTGGISIRFAPKANRWPHDWPFEDIEDSDRCRWCGMSFIHHVFTDLP